MRCVNIGQQRGAALVETAIVILVFLTLVLAVIELALMMLKYERSVEATRAGVRYAIVNNPVCDLFGEFGGGITDCPLDCSAGGNGTVSHSCGSGGNGCGSVADGTGMLGSMARILPELEAANVVVTYSCSGAGFDGRPEPIPGVTVALDNVSHPLILPRLFGMPQGWEVSLPGFASTRLGEDLNTVE